MPSTLIRVLTCLALAGALTPASAAAGVKLVTRDEPVSAAARGDAGARHTFGARKAPLRFNMVGLHWKGSGTVWFRTALEPGQWSEWRTAAPEAEDAPDPGSEESERRRGWNLGSPYWTGAAVYIDYRTAGRVTKLRTHFLQSDVDAGPVTTARAAAPSIIRRSQWGADESIVRAPPWYADRVRLAIVHHTAGTNSYSASQSAAIVRGIQRYHVLSNGWNDIGYNFLVDKYGQVFEGRRGGIDQPVGGAHAAGFNTGSTGIAVLGSYSSADITRSARSALVKLIAWRLDVAHVDPVKNLTYVSHGSDKFPAGTSVRMRAVSGHRDTGYTSCPGNLLYGRLGGIARAAAARGLPKLYEPAVTGGLGGMVRIRARLSGSLPWTVTIRDPDGSVVAQGSATGATVDWTWDASGIFFGDYRYSIDAGPNVRGAGGRVPGPPPLAVRKLDATPRVLTLNGDGVGEATTLSFSLTTSATVTATVRNQAGTAVARPLNDRSVWAGPFRMSWNGRGTGGDPLPDGRYTLEVDAVSPGQQASASRAIVVDRTLGFLDVSPSAFSPNADTRNDTATVSFALSRAADVNVSVRRNGQRVIDLVSGSLGTGAHAFAWSGSTSAGSRAPDGVYTTVVLATSSLGTRSLRTSLALDTKPPAVRILWARWRSGRTAVRFSLNEPALVRIRFGELVVETARTAGTFTVRRRVRVERVRVTAIDAAQNVARARARVR
jgi:flagellar hook assembly protein FlgD